MITVYKNLLNTCVKGHYSKSNEEAGSDCLLCPTDFLSRAWLLSSDEVWVINNIQHP